MIIPPSVLVVIYGAVANVSVGALLIAQALPGILIGLSLIVFSYGISVVYNYPRESEHWLGIRALLEGLKEAVLPAGVPIIIIGGITLGVFTATEAAVVATAYALLITMVIYRSLPASKLVKVFADAGHLTAVILFCNENALPEEKDNARKKVEKLYKDIVNGKDFAATAREFSEDGRAAKMVATWIISREDICLRNLTRLHSPSKKMK